MSVPWPSPPICEDCNVWMVPDHGLNDDMKHDGTLLYVCPDCCQAVDRKPTLNGGEPKCDFRCPPGFKPGAKQDKLADHRYTVHGIDRARPAAYVGSRVDLAEAAAVA